MRLLGAGLVGVVTAGWIDLADNCVVGPCVEHDSFALSALWALTIGCLVSGGIAAGIRAARGR
jgi:hypothetical protein